VNSRNPNQVESRLIMTRPGHDRNKLARNVLLAAFWPAVAAIIYILRFPRERAVLGIVIFCGYVGWALTPTLGSDSHTYMLRILDLKAGIDYGIKEPVVRAIALFIAFLDLNVQWYFLFLGLIFGVFWVVCARLLLQNIPRQVSLGLPALFFLCAFFLYYPVFPAVNARYTTGMWVLFAATLLALNGRWRTAMAAAAFGAMVHYGHIFFVLALAFLYLTRYAKSYQVIVAYVILIICIVLPPQFMLDMGEGLAGLFGGSLGQQIEGSVRFGERSLAGDFAGGENTRAWFINWFQFVLFFGLIVSGHILFWRYIRQDRRNALYQLWVLIILMWALLYSMQAHGIAQSRLQRNTSGLMLMWHAMYFLKYRAGWRTAVAITFGPLAFFNVVAYRIWFHQISVAVFMPLPFGYFADWWPRVMELLGFG
jgi:hypothetical protein